MPTDPSQHTVSALTNFHWVFPFIGTPVTERNGINWCTSEQTECLSELLRLAGNAQKSSRLLSHLRSALCMFIPVLGIQTAEMVLHVHQSPLNSLIWGPHCSPHASSNTLMLACSPASSSLKTSTFSHHHPKPLGMIRWIRAQVPAEGPWALSLVSPGQSSLSTSV